MTDYPTGPQPQLPPDNLIEQVVEKAATKVAAAAQNTTDHARDKPELVAAMNRTEAWLVTAAILLMAFTTLVLTIQVRNRLASHAGEFRQLCETVAEQNPNTDPVDKAKAISNCSRPGGN
jgi:hypothetical protein